MSLAFSGCPAFDRFYVTIEDRRICFSDSIGGIALKDAYSGMKSAFDARLISRQTSPGSIVGSLCISLVSINQFHGYDRLVGRFGFFDR